MGFISKYSNKKRKARQEKTVDLLMKQAQSKIIETYDEFKVLHTKIWELGDFHDKNYLHMKTQWENLISEESVSPLFQDITERYNDLREKMEKQFKNDFYTCISRGPISEQRALQSKEFTVSTEKIFGRKDHIFLFQNNDTIFVYSDPWWHPECWNFKSFDVKIDKPYIPLKSNKKEDNDANNLDDYKFIDIKNPKQGKEAIDFYRFAYELELKAHNDDIGTFVIKSNPEHEKNLTSLELLFEGETGVEAMKDALNVINNYSEQCHEIGKEISSLTNKIETILQELNSLIINRNSEVYKKTDIKELEAYSEELDLEAYQLDRLNEIGDTTVKLANQIYEQ